MARKGGKAGKAKVPAGVSGQYRPYTTALKMEKLRREYEQDQARDSTAPQRPEETDVPDKSSKGMELRSRPVRGSPTPQKKPAPKFQLDELEEVTATPEHSRRGDIKRSSTAGNGRRVSAGLSDVPGRSNSTASAAPSEGRHKRTRIEEDHDEGLDTDIVAPLTALPRRNGRGSNSSSPLPHDKQGSQRPVHADDSDAHTSSKRMKYSASLRSDPGNSKHSTPKSLSRLSLGGGSAMEPTTPTTSRELQISPDFGESGDKEMRSPHLRDGRVLDTQNLRSLPLYTDSNSQSREFGTRLEKLLSSFRSDILKEVRDLQNAQAAQLKRVDLKFTENMQSIRTQLQDLSGLVQNRNCGNGGSTSAAQGKTPLAEWELKLDEMTPLKKEVFSSSVFARVLGYNLPLCVTQICSEHAVTNERNDISRNIVDMASVSLATLLFSLKPNDSRDKNAEGIGKRHSDFKFSVIQNTFYNVQKNTFLQFRASGARGEDGRSLSDDGEGLLTQPAWLKPGFVSSTTILAARSFLENKQQAKRDKVREAPSRNDVAMHGAVKAYRYLTSHLHDGREKVKSMFFQDLGYLLVDWAGLTSDVDQCELSLRWEDFTLDSNDVVDVYFNLSNIPDTSVARRGGNVNEADTNNKDLINDLYKRSKEMVLIAEHEVFVLSGDSSKNKQRKHSGGQRRRMRRLIHMIEVAANFCKEFTQLPNIWAFLRSHADSLRCIYAIAIVFREMTLNFLCKADLSDRRIPSPSDVLVGRTSLLQLLPGKGSRASLMASRCVRMVESEYEAMNQPDYDTETRLPNGEEEYIADVGAEIQASATLGVAAL